MTTKELVLHYARRWKGRYGQSYTISWKKEMAQAKRLCTVYGADYVVQLIDYYFDGYVSPFSRRAGHTLGAFVAELNSIVAAYAEEQKKRRPIDDDLYDRLEEAKRNA